MKWFVFRIRKRYLDAIEKELKKVEYRVDSEYWRLRFGIRTEFDRQHPILAVARAWQEMGEVGALFLSGKRTHRRKISDIHYEKRPRGFSAQGLKDVPTAHCFAIYLGSEVVETP